ncbi:MAG TPA: polymer-forming cytoskeletal protein [Chthoniobacterales bacterium]|nr:polymer-forming cytoskeletal protein [Chthoniobacterales bacterium]
MAKSPAKVSVDCPHCGFQQMEYAAARSTLCRQCGKHFVVERKDAPAPKAPSAPSEVGANAASLFRRIEGIWSRPRITSATCFDCGAVQEITSAATSTICPSCSVHMDLRDYKINGSFSRNLRTHGEVHITPTGDLSSSSVVCRAAVIEGKLRGSLHCFERAEFLAAGKVHGKLVAPEVLIGKRANLQFYRQMQVRSIEIRGSMTGEIVAETVVAIRSTGSLDGNVVARSINVEKGGTFTGQLVIGRQSLEQAELLPDFEPAKAPVLRRPAGPSGEAFGLPATS